MPIIDPTRPPILLTFQLSNSTVSQNPVWNVIWKDQWAVQTRPFITVITKAVFLIPTKHMKQRLSCGGKHFEGNSDHLINLICKLIHYNKEKNKTCRCSAIVKKFSMLYGSWRFITTFMIASCGYLPCAIWSVDTLPSYFFKINFNILLPTPRVPSGLFLLGFPPKTLYAFLSSHTCYMSSSSFIWSSKQYVARSSNHEAADYVVFLQFPVTSSLLCPNIVLSTLLSTTIGLCFSLHGQTKFHTHMRNKNQQDALFYSQFISIISLYMFRSGLLLIIRRYYSDPASSQST